MASPFRTKEMTERHEAYKKSAESTSECALCNKQSIREFGYWRIVENSFPYDLVSSVSQILIIKRYTTEEGMSREETEEFKDIKMNVLGKEYDYTIECMPKEMSIPTHYHVHILKK